MAVRFLLAFLLFATVWVPPAAADDWAALAREAYAKVVSEPGNPEFLNLYGYYQMRAGEYQAAEKVLRKAISLRKNFPVAWNNLGAVYMHTQRFSEAEKCFRNALRLDKEYSKAHYNLAVTRFKQGEYREAIELYLDLRNRDRAYVDLRTDPAKAERELEAALKANPNDPVLRAVKQRYDQYKQDREDDPWRF
jgi:tetratricopeptide (TPR) repeat protein